MKVESDCGQSYIRNRRLCAEQGSNQSPNTQDTVHNNVLNISQPSLVSTSDLRPASATPRPKMQIRRPKRFDNSPEGPRTNHTTDDQDLEVFWNETIHHEDPRGNAQTVLTLKRQF